LALGGEKEDPERALEKVPEQQAEELGPERMVKLKEVGQV
jgi:hypothetical protein